jgi:hypothetical protein
MQYPVLPRNPIVRIPLSRAKQDLIDNLQYDSTLQPIPHYLDADFVDITPTISNHIHTFRVSAMFQYKSLPKTSVKSFKSLCTNINILSTEARTQSTHLSTSSLHQSCTSAIELAALFEQPFPCLQDMDSFYNNHS